MKKHKMGLLVMAYGTPYKDEDLIPYYTHIRNGKAPSEEMVAELKEKYDYIGGVSPLAEITLKQANLLEKHLNEIQDIFEFEVYLGLKHIHPFIEDAVEKMKENGINEAVSIVLAPHYSTYSIEIYNKRAMGHSQKINGPMIYPINSWYDEPSFIEYWTMKINDILSQMTVSEKEKTMIIFSAHSLPEKILQYHDPYPSQLQHSADLIAGELGFAQYTIAWQSKGNTPESWLEPDVLDLTAELHKSGFTSFIYAPIGFVSDHLEVLYDNDYECFALTKQLNAKYYRPPMPNTHPLFISSLANSVLNEICKQKKVAI
ncbi:ferrochelatase [Anoxybacillus vitaminiphilus]|uniref:Coproporphyrin III ferrochelatase n=1 Tax=Paranoxybacillus vitaminiphilus TaxID=581036 RepID=A0A327YDY1_9BACL|nr:ferrochelatase [Anoxybacillus vitaminiphilus]RAK18372.1 ferrochelatase [Anoxybacillus vitaminiphilus]